MLPGSLAKPLGGALSYSGRTFFRATKGTLVLHIALALIVGTIATVSWKTDEAIWITSCIWIVFVLLLIAIVEVAISFVRLEESEFRMRKNFRLLAISRGDIESVSVAKGCPIILHLKNGDRVDLPDLGYQGLDNSLRSWIHAA